MRARQVCCVSSSIILVTLCTMQMVPLFNMSLENVAFSLHGRPEYLNSTMSFSLSARSFNDKHDSWEPLIEPMDGFLR